MLPPILLSYEQWSMQSPGSSILPSLLFDACREGIPAAVWPTVRHDLSNWSRKMMENEENWLQHAWNLKPNHQKLDLITSYNACGTHSLVMTTKQDKLAK